MSARPDTAIQIPIGDIDDSFLGCKVRTAGVIAEYDVETACITLTSGRRTIKVSVHSIVLEASGEANALLRLGCKVSVLGTLVAGTSESPLRLSAIRIIDAHALDLVQWEEAARRISQSMHSRAENG